MNIIELRQTGILIATNNPHKVYELRQLLEPYAIPVKTPEELGIKINVKETGKTFEENAKLKVEAYYSIAKIPTIADDSGLEVDALNKEPGVFSARYGGEHLTDEERNFYLLEKIKHIADYLRTARFVCVLAFKVAHNEPVKFYKGIVEGKILYQPRGKNGFGYDPIFEEIRTKKSFAELSLEEKNQISHRGKALQQFLNDLILILK
ncbi:MAG: non-canonical purine NTP pyrophosphatase [Leptospiraceae bacterium]|nr:MAG: non-canonical purine NTP pyrophosphatase [Leptospiraceae bacterium]